MDAQIDLARKIVHQYVHTAPFSSTWSKLVEQLIDALDIGAPLSRRKQFCDEAKEKIREAFPNSQDKATWRSPIAAWTTPAGVDKIIVIVVDLARLKGWLQDIS